MVRCDMCENRAIAKIHTDIEGKPKILHVCGVCEMILSNNAEIKQMQVEYQKKDQWWVEKYNHMHTTMQGLAHAQKIAIGIRNAKIKELKDYTINLSRKYNEKITILEEILYKAVDKITKLTQAVSMLTHLDKIEYDQRITTLEQGFVDEHSRRQDLSLQVDILEAQLKSVKNKQQINTKFLGGLLKNE